MGARPSHDPQYTVRNEALPGYLTQAQYGPKPELPTHEPKRAPSLLTEATTRRYTYRKAEPGESSEQHAGSELLKPCCCAA